MADVVPTANYSFNQTRSSEEEVKHLVKILQLFFYSLIIAVGCTGNGLICLAILTRKKRKTSEYFILNLAIADLAICALSMPLDMFELVSGYWPYGSFLCKLVYPSQTVLMAVSVATLLAMSLERYRAIMHPLRPRIKGNVALVVIGIVWICSVLLVSPYMIVLTYKNSTCEENWPSDYPGYPKIFTVSVFIILYVCPLLGITVAYLTVSRKLYRDINITGSTLMRHRQGKMRAKRNMRIVKIFVMAVMAFAICMLPNHVIWLWKDFGAVETPTLQNDLLVFAQIMVYANSSINPYIFGTLHAGCTNCREFVQSPRGHLKRMDAHARTFSLRMSFTSSSRLRTMIRRVSTSRHGNDSVLQPRGNRQREKDESPDNSECKL